MFFLPLDPLPAAAPAVAAAVAVVAAAAWALAREPERERVSSTTVESTAPGWRKEGREVGKKGRKVVRNGGDAHTSRDGLPHPPSPPLLPSLLPSLPPSLPPVASSLSLTSFRTLRQYREDATCHNDGGT